MLLLTVIIEISCTSSRTDQTPLTVRHWVVSGRSVNIVLHSDPSLRLLFDKASTYLTGDRFRRAYEISGLDKPILVATYASFSAFRADVRNSSVPHRVRAVMYDPEAWEFTPAPERRAPARYMRKFSGLARRLDYAVVLSPSRDLMTVEGSSCRSRGGESINAAYIRCHIAGVGARFSDVFDVQAQLLEEKSAEYRSFVALAAKQARRANRSVVLVSQLSTAPADRPVTAQVLADASRAVSDVVDGFFLFVERGDGGVAAQFLRQISGQRP
jgi:hypothetical protein